MHVHAWQDMIFAPQLHDGLKLPPGFVQLLDQRAERLVAPIAEFSFRTPK
jgi:hypothetical protein